MLLHSYAFNREVPTEVWNLFENAEKLGNKLDYTVEIIDAAMRGDIDVKRKFNLAGYIYSINEKKELENGRKRKKFLSINSSCEEVEDYGDGIPVDALTPYVEKEDAYDLFEKEQEVVYAVNEINKMSHDILLFHNVDIKKCLLHANRGTPESISLLKKLVKDNSNVASLIEVILSSGQPLEDLF